MSERDIGQEIPEGIREIKAYKAGKVNLVQRELGEPSDAKEIRANLELSGEDYLYPARWFEPVTVEELTIELSESLRKCNAGIN